MRKPCWMLVVMMAAAVIGSTGVAFAGPNTTLPFADTFEGYTNGTPLIDGMNGWYGSDSSIIVQTNTVRSGTNAAMIPDDGTLSNRFQGIVSTNIWLQMDVLPRLYEGTNYTVDTNISVLF